jgi:hypothetical protein
MISVISLYRLALILGNNALSHIPFIHVTWSVIQLLDVYTLSKNVSPSVPGNVIALSKSFHE